jgi:hypothetical protein
MITVRNAKTELYSRLKNSNTKKFPYIAVTPEPGLGRKWVPDSIKNASKTPSRALAKFAPEPIEGPAFRFPL